MDYIFNEIINKLQSSLDWLPPVGLMKMLAESQGGR